MPKIERWIIDKVLDATSIVEVIGEFVELRKAGVNYTGYCPFHDDHHDGNFIVRPEGVKTGGGTYRCFVCDAKGGVVQLLMQHEKMTFPDAIRWLGKKYNIDVDDVPINNTPPPPRPKPVPLPMLEIPREIVKKSMRYSNMYKVHEQLLDISTFGVEKWGNTVYKIAVRGGCYGDRATPHIHIFLNSDENPFLLFTFEVSIVDMLCKNEINLIYQYDKARNICHKEKKDCSWTGYEEIRMGLTDFLFRPWSSDFSDNLDKGIYCWNKETDFEKTEKEGINVLRLYFEENGLTPLPQYEKYLEDYK